LCEGVEVEVGGDGEPGGVGAPVFGGRAWAAAFGPGFDGGGAGFDAPPAGGAVAGGFVGGVDRR
jgi:hypothetical protein